jgi:hypothetical protein
MSSNTLIRWKYQVLPVFLLSSVILISSGHINAQNYREEPVWINMMNDTSMNYFETVKAFREYFKDRVLPKEPYEVIGEDNFEIEVGLEEKDLEEKRKEDKKIRLGDPDYSAEVRSFKGWFYRTKLWVREDGSIIGPKEQQAIIDRQQTELKAVEESNGRK